MTDDDKKTPIEHTLDVFVYLPLGFMLEFPRSIPQYIDRGRRELSPSRLLSRGGRSSPPGLFDAGERLSRLQAQTHSTLRALGVSGPRAGTTERSDNGSSSSNGRSSMGATPTTPVTPSAPAAGSDRGAADQPGEPGQAGTSATGGTPAATAPVPDPSGLAITDYDSLSASQVVPRLDSLAADELEGIRAYETATRGRKTILNKIAQIQSA